MFRRHPIPLLILSCFLPAAHADDEALYFGELPVVASVSRLPQKISETPASVTVIDQDMIRASGARTVEDLLRLVPGFQVTSHNQDPALVTYHGLSSGIKSGTVTDEYSSRVQVLIDGRSQFSPLFKSGVNWNLLPVALENIERIEVTRGSNTVSYGSNAVLGVINIITVDPAQVRGWMISANHGNNQISDQTIRWGGGTDNADIRFTAKQFQDGGFRRAYYSQWVDAQDTRRSGLLDLNVTLRLNNQDELRITASQANDTSEYGTVDKTVSSGLTRQQTDPLREMQSVSRTIGMHWRRILSSAEEVSLRYAYTEDWASMPYQWYYKFTPKEINSSITSSAYLNSGGISRLHELEFEHRLSLNDLARMTWGSGAKTTSVRSEAQFSDNAPKKRNDVRIFANLEYKPNDDWLLNLGASGNHDSISGNFVDRRASVSYHITPEHTLRASASRAHRTPSIYETLGKSQLWATYNSSQIKDITYYSQGVQPELIDAYEIGYLGEYKSLRATLDIRAFQERVPNRIQIAPLPLPSTMPDDADAINGSRNYGNLAAQYLNGRADSAINLENVRIHGYEYQLRWQPLENTRLIFGGALIGIEANLNNPSVIADSWGTNIDKISRQTRASAPAHSHSVMLIQRLPYGIQGSVMYFYNDSMRWRRNGGPIQNSKRVDWRLAKAFNWGGVRNEVAYTMQMANAPQEGRFANDNQIARIATRQQWLSWRTDF